MPPVTAGADQTGNVTKVGGVAFSDAKHMGLGVSYKAGAFDIGVNAGTMKYDDEMVMDKTTGTGLSVGYKLGGGVEAKLGYGRSKTGDMEAVSTWSAGLAMSF